MTVLLLDCNYLAWRSFHSTGKNLDRGTTYGFLSTLQKLRDQFQPSRIAFCFDGDGPSKRKEIYPDYKANRGRNNVESDCNDRIKVHGEIKELRDKHLPALGWRNVFHAPGFEADDWAGAICHHLNGKEKCVLVSADQDFWQLISPSVSVWNPTTNYLETFQTFQEKWSIEPEDWISVKAIAGCKSDNIKGVPGVGEKTAARFLAGELSKGREAAVREKVNRWEERILFNLRLVKIPLPGLEVTLRDDIITGGTWRRFCEKMKMTSLLRGYGNSQASNQRNKN